MRLVDRAASSGPDNAYVLSARSDLLMNAGLMGAAVDDAQRAADMDPLSPGMRSFHISTLAHAGRIEAAQEQLAEAERLWPGATTLIDARYRLSLRYGDPADALRLEQSGAMVGAASSPGSRAGRFRGALLRARLDPTKENVDRAISLTWSTYRRTPETIGDLMQTLGEFGREDELFPELLGWQRTKQIPYFADVLFRPTLAGFRKDPRFMRVAAQLGLLDFWRKRGIWPDFCSEPDLPYDCEKEAAKIAA